MLVAAIWAVPDEGAVGAPLVILGATTLILGVLLSRAEGPISIGPEGLKLVIKGGLSRIPRFGGILAGIYEGWSRRGLLAQIPRGRRGG